MKYTIILMTLLLSSNLFAQFQDQSNKSVPCGTQGSIEERIQDCSNMSNGRNKKMFDTRFILVSRNAKGKEVYQDKSKLLWANSFTEVVNHFDAIEICKQYRSETRTEWGIKIKWRLPTIEEFEDALVNSNFILTQKSIEGIWTDSDPDGSFYGRSSHAKYIDTANENTVASAHRFYKKLSVRCVAD